MAAYVVIRNDQNPRLQERLDQLRQLPSADSSRTPTDSSHTPTDTMEVQ
jgi:hypothetical protein